VRLNALLSTLPSKNYGLSGMKSSSLRFRYGKKIGHLAIGDHADIVMLQGFRIVPVEVGSCVSSGVFSDFLSEELQCWEREMECDEQ